MLWRWPTSRFAARLTVPQAERAWSQHPTARRPSASCWPRACSRSTPRSAGRASTWRVRARGRASPARRPAAPSQGAAPGAVLKSGQGTRPAPTRRADRLMAEAMAMVDAAREQGVELRLTAASPCAATAPTSISWTANTPTSTSSASRRTQGDAPGLRRPRLHREPLRHPGHRRRTAPVRQDRDARGARQATGEEPPEPRWSTTSTSSST